MIFLLSAQRSRLDYASCLYPILLLHSKKKVRCFYGKWIDSFFSYDVDVFDSTVMLTKAMDTSYGASEAESPSDPPIQVRQTWLHIYVQNTVQNKICLLPIRHEQIMVWFW